MKYKPYIEAKKAEDRPDEEVADEHWRNHLARNDSIIVDVCQGQYRSKFVCPACKKLSITFDPFMYLSLPLPATTMHSMTLTVMSTDGSTLPFPVIVTIPKYGRCKDLVQALSTTCSLRDDEKLLVTEIRDLIWTCLVIWRAEASSFCVFVHITLHVFWLRCKFYIFVGTAGHVW